MLIPPRKVHTHSAWDRALVPLVNVVFLLMVFFVIAGRIESSEQQAVEVPRSAIGQAGQGKPVMLVLEKDGSILMDGKKLVREGLYASLKLVFLADKDNPISIKADHSLPSDYILSALNLIKRAGGHNITLITRR